MKSNTMRQADNNQELPQELCRELLSVIGEDPERPGLLKTPKRFSDSIMELTQGYREDLSDVVKDSIIYENYKEMILVKNIEFFSLCEHHILPFFGKVHFAYIPDGKIIGLSKIPKVVKLFSRRLQVQERLTVEIVEAIEGILKPKGVACMIEASHMCMLMRGDSSVNSSLVTNKLAGCFLSDSTIADQFYKMIKMNQ